VVGVTSSELSTTRVPRRTPPTNNNELLTWQTTHVCQHRRRGSRAGFDFSTGGIGGAGNPQAAKADAKFSAAEVEVSDDEPANRAGGPRGGVLGTATGTGKFR
jgi:hypothetical protein